MRLAARGIQCHGFRIEDFPIQPSPSLFIPQSLSHPDAVMPSRQSVLFLKPDQYQYRVICFLQTVCNLFKFLFLFRVDRSGLLKFLQGNMVFKLQGIDPGKQHIIILRSLWLDFRPLIIMLSRYFSGNKYLPSRNVGLGSNS